MTPQSPSPPCPNPGPHDIGADSSSTSIFNPVAASLAATFGLAFVGSAATGAAGWVTSLPLQVSGASMIVVAVSAAARRHTEYLGAMCVAAIAWLLACWTGSILFWFVERTTTQDGQPSDLPFWITAIGHLAIAGLALKHYRPAAL